MRGLVDRLSLLGLGLATACALAALGGGLGSRFGWWNYGAGIATIAVVFWIAAATAAACAIAAVLAATRAGARPALVMALAGVAIAGVTAWIPYHLRAIALALPPIHDITTDLSDPPQFVRAAKLRQPGENPAAYDGPGVAEQQRKGYPDLAPLVLKAPRETVFSAAREVLASMGLDLVDTDAAQGRIEATATSLLFGFKDDVVLRIIAVAGRTRVDVRSKSRVGVHDLGANAARVREFLSRLKAKLAGG